MEHACMKTINALFASWLFLMLIAGTSHAEMLSNAKGFFGKWKDFEQKNYTLRITRSGGGLILLGENKSNHAANYALSFGGGVTFRSRGRVHAAYREGWDRIRATEYPIPEAEEGTRINITGRLGDWEIRQVYEIRPDGVTFDCTVEVVHPMPQRRMLSSGGGVIFQEHTPFLLTKADNSVHEGVFGEVPFDDIPDVTAIRLDYPGKQLALRLLEGPPFVIRDNGPKYSSHMVAGFRGDLYEAARSMGPGDRYRYSFLITVHPRKEEPETPSPSGTGNEIEESKEPKPSELTSEPEQRKD
jgi:hypothetical protein